MEAIACGVNVLTTKVGGMLEVMTHEETGYLGDPGDPAQLRDSILFILNDPHRLDVANRALEMARSSYSWSVIAAKTEAVLLAAMKNGKC